MSEMSSELRVLEMQARQARYLERARRENFGIVVSRSRRRLFRSRSARHAE